LTFVNIDRRTSTVADQLDAGLNIGLTLCNRSLFPYVSRYSCGNLLATSIASIPTYYLCLQDKNVRRTV